MKINSNEVELLADISKILTDHVDHLEIITLLERHFSKYGRSSGYFNELKKFNFYVSRENSKILKDFAKSYAAIEAPAQNKHSENLYFSYSQISSFSFILNERGYKLDGASNLSAIKCFNDDNILLFPLKKDNVPFGVMEFVFAGPLTRLLNYDFFALLAIISFQLSLKIQNTNLTQRMQKNVAFQESMKEIAKIIETQYDISYITPIIGEMLNKFISNHLIYIFLIDSSDNSFNLAWPKTKINETILTELSRITVNSEFTLADKKKMGLFPLKGKSGLIGCIVAHSDNEELGNRDIQYLNQLSKQSSITLQRANAYAETLKHATMDALTGLNNRRQLEHRIKQEIANAKRQSLPLCAIMMDVDFFKNVNDTYGHIAGDAVLKELAEIIKKTIRESDIAARYGGEEFSILLPMTTMKDAACVAERLRSAVERTTINCLNEKGEIATSLNITISIGVYQYKETDSDKELYEKADKGLYKAKSTGRNKVVLVR
jgi:diguanylate cyclase (GGDEF)-like protein